MEILVNTLGVEPGIPVIHGVIVTGKHPDGYGLPLISKQPLLNDEFEDEMGEDLDFSLDDIIKSPLLLTSA